MLWDKTRRTKRHKIVVYIGCYLGMKAKGFLLILNKRAGRTVFHRSLNTELSKIWKTSFISLF